jgi:hypothetical protein
MLKHSGLSRCRKNAEQLLTQLAALILVKGQFIPTPCFVHRVDAKALEFRTGV